MFVFCAIAAAHPAAFAQTVERAVGLEGQPNFRDIGGLETSDGRKVRSGLVYRSGELPRLSEADIAKLRELGVKTVVNFLTPEEIEYRGEDRLPEGVRTISIPITGEISGVPDAAAAIIEARKTGDFRKFPRAFNPQIHKDLVDGVADDQYTQLFEILADESNYPIVYHCSHGVHRTGTATALLLSALGVPWDTVREDYLLSNKTRQSEVNPRIEQLEGLAAKLSMSDDERQENSEAIRSFYVLQPDYIDASLHGAREKYGSLDRYLEVGLGVSALDRSVLQKFLTVPQGTANVPDD
jgi:protein-tyrosine phosphatase